MHRDEAVVLRELHVGERCEWCDEPAIQRLWVIEPHWHKADGRLMNRPIQASACGSHAVNFNRRPKRVKVKAEQTTVFDFLP